MRLAVYDFIRFAPCNVILHSDRKCGNLCELQLKEFDGKTLRVFDEQKGDLFLAM